MAPRIALLAVALAALAAAPLRVFLETPGPVRPCVPEGRGTVPRHWLGCAADPGVPRPLAGDELLAIGLPLDVNRASARELAFVPGLGARLAEALVQDRDRNGPFASVEDVTRVRGIGPRKLEKARPALTLAP
jgi:competence protein ComEA